jgi:uncharacterized protein (DUF1778 family)
MTQIPPTQGAARETDFVRQTAEEVERRETGLPQSVTYLSDRDWHMLTDLIDNPPVPSAVLVESLREYQRLIRSGRVKRTEGR